jgi:ABC-type multidrug transport system fused ATPase/permease subunit
MSKRIGAFRPLARLVDGGARFWVAVIAVLRLAERLLLAAAAFSFSSDRTRSAVAITVVLAISAALRAGARAPLLAAMRRRFVAIVTDVLLHREEHARSKNEALATDVIVFDGLWAAEDMAAERVPGIAADAIAAVIIGGLLGWTLPGRTIAIGLAALFVAALAAEGTRRIAGAQASQSWKAFVPVGASMEACIQGGLELVANGRDRDQSAVVRARNEHFVKASWRADWLSGLSGRLPILLAFVGVMAAIVWVQSETGETPEAALAQAIVVASFLPPLASLVSNLVEVTRSMPKVEGMRELLEPGPKLAAEGAQHDVPRLPQTIRWDSIAYAYPTGPTERGSVVLSQCSGEWQPGKLLALAGPNGAGKSTVFRLLLGFDRPTKGQILVGEIPAADIDKAAWREHIAYLSQRPFFPKGATVREAIAFLAREATDEEMTAVLERVGVWKRLTRESKDAPLDVLVSELSAGERQRVALARVIAQDAALVLLDEPDANLDRAGVELLGDLLRDLVDRQKKMVVFVAHDEELLGFADDVLRFPQRRASGAVEKAEEDKERWLSSGSRFM